MSRSLQNPGSSPAGFRSLDIAELNGSSHQYRTQCSSSGIAALSIEFVAKPNESHKVQTALPAAIQGALGEVAGFAGSFVLIANHEARLVTVVTLWRDEDRAKRCGENVRWVRALLAPYLDRCLRVQTFAAYVPEAAPRPGPFEETCSEEAVDLQVKEMEAMCVA